MTMRRILLAIAATFALLGAGLAAPAHADTQASKCWKYDDGIQYVAYICAAFTFQRDADGTGGTLQSVRIYASGDVGHIFESKVEDCDNLRLWNDASEVRWRKDNGECDLYASSPSKSWTGLGVGFHASKTINLGWSFYPKIDFGRDPGYTHISIAVTF